jgi:hypothetical protein
VTALHAGKIFVKQKKEFWRKMGKFNVLQFSFNE